MGAILASCWSCITAITFAVSCKIDWVPVSAGQGIEAAGRNFLDEGPGDLAGMLGPVSEVSEGEVPLHPYGCKSLAMVIRVLIATGIDADAERGAD